MRISYSQNRLSDFGSTTSSGENIQQIEGVTGEGGGGSGGGEEVDKEAEMVAQSMAQTEYSKDVLDKVTSYKVRLTHVDAKLLFILAQFFYTRAHKFGTTGARTSLPTLM